MSRRGWRPGRPRAWPDDAIPDDGQSRGVGNAGTFARVSPLQQQADEAALAALEKQMADAAAKAEALKAKLGKK
jgi:hypothetical protein